MSTCSLMDLPSCCSRNTFSPWLSWITLAAASSGRSATLSSAGSRATLALPGPGVSRPQPTAGSNRVTTRRSRASPSRKSFGIVMVRSPFLCPFEGRGERYFLGALGGAVNGPEGFPGQVRRRTVEHDLAPCQAHDPVSVAPGKVELVQAHHQGEVLLPANVG